LKIVHLVYTHTCLNVWTLLKPGRV